MRRNSLVSILALLLALAAPAGATWSIILVDEETGEVAVGTVTCLTSFDLLAIVPVVVVGKGGGAVQSAGDFDGIRRPVIFEQLMLGTPPEEILEMLESISGHQSRQYGIVDANGGSVTFSGSQNGAWAGGVTGSVGTMHYAIQGNVLTGECVIQAIEDAVSTVPGDLPARLMTGMQRARQRGGDGRCSCSPSNPPACGCPPLSFTKSGHIGGMIVARIGDADDPACTASGCADGDYFMRLNVAFQASGSPDPVLQLQQQFNAWRNGLTGRPDAVQSVVEFDPPVMPANGVATTTMIVVLRDWQGNAITAPIDSISVEHAPDSAGLSTIGAIEDQGGGTIHVMITSGTAPGVDRFRITVDDGVRPVVLTPDPRLEYFTDGDVNGDGSVDFGDLLMVLSEWGDCPAPPASCPADVDGDGIVGFADALAVLSNWS